jgi:hypothetical protein
LASQPKLSALAALGVEVVNSPIISSMISSSVTRPCTSPYSSTMMPRRSLFSWKYCSWVNRRVSCGMK